MKYLLPFLSLLTGCQKPYASKSESIVDQYSYASPPPYPTQSIVVIQNGYQSSSLMPHIGLNYCIHRRKR